MIKMELLCPNSERCERNLQLSQRLLESTDCEIGAFTLYLNFNGY